MALDVQAEKLPDSKPSAKIKLEPLEVLVTEGVTEGVNVLVGVDDGPTVVAVEVGVLEGVIEGVSEGPLVFVGDGVFVRVEVLVGVINGKMYWITSLGRWVEIVESEVL